MNIVIMAGGGGSRLWPLSRQSRPKQFLDLGSGKTLIEHTYHRISQLARPEDIFIATLQEYAEQTRKLLPDIPNANYCFEPARRDTAPAFAAVAAKLIQKGRGGEPTLFVGSDHIFTKEKQFVADLQKAVTLIQAHPETIITLGHIPTFPETGYGYIEVGEPLAGEKNVYHVKSFKEKPDQATAEAFIHAGTYYWNMANFGVVPTHLIHEIKKFEPELSAGLEAYQEALDQEDPAVSDKIYRTLPKIAIDYAVMERTEKIITIVGDYGWSDIGSWRAVHEIFGVEGDHMPDGHHVHVDSKGNYIYNTTDKVVSVVGLKDTITVVTEDAILLTTAEGSQKVKEVVQKLESDGKGQYL